jgi:hypothetical protein
MYEQRSDDLKNVMVSSDYIRIKEEKVILDNVVPWGRSFDEYRYIFSLTEEDLKKMIVTTQQGERKYLEACHLIIALKLSMSVNAFLSFGWMLKHLSLT